MLRSGVPVVKPRIRANKQPSLGNITSQIDDISRSSDRLSFDQHHIDFQYFSKTLGLPKLNQSMSISDDHTLERHNSLFGIEKNSNHSNLDENPIPLPPRDRSKTLQSKSSLLRHQRKHPLIIPGNGISRTLAKISTTAMGDQVDGKFSSRDESNSKGIIVPNEMTTYKSDTSSNSPDEFEQRIDSELAALDSLPTGNNLFTPDLLDFSKNLEESEIEDNQFEKLLVEKLGSSTIEVKPNHPVIINSLHSNQLDVEVSNLATLQVPTMYSNNIKSTQKKSLQLAEFFERSNNSGIAISRSRINVDIASDDIISRQNSISEEHNSNSVKNLRISGTQIQKNELSRHSDHVSCEDLLEFACDGPNIHRTRGPHNGEQSDEVRIMLKVLHGYSTPESCVAALNKTDWNILAAIKMERLQDLLKKENNFVSLEDCKLMLNQCNGDVVKAATLLKSVDDTASV
ncbi:hypothetical protein PV326_009107 [Microctonus aethiopoides]|uniref:Tyrosine-protein kinase PR2 n=1 Tax=Microctonus aethiopoides TaxID=144406 RepID=A0AA39FWC4_9HYME|nr:hypothetical protein PV326_009107 [Microctonus aethiopoides]KAK0177075.1 hypothetical protein PV328_001154 [Microctonus aethiopoides]